MSTEAAELPATVVLNKADLVPPEECSAALAVVGALVLPRTFHPALRSFLPGVQVYVFLLRNTPYTRFFASSRLTLLFAQCMQ